MQESLKSAASIVNRDLNIELNIIKRSISGHIKLEYLLRFIAEKRLSIVEGISIKMAQVKYSVIQLFKAIFRDLRRIISYELFNNAIRNVYQYSKA